MRIHFIVLLALLVAAVITLLIISPYMGKPNLFSFLSLPSPGTSEHTDTQAFTPEKNAEQKDYFTTNEDNTGTVQVAAHPTDITVLVNKQIMLPPDYKPSDLVEPNVRFLYAEQDESHKMRKEAARALEDLFAAAKKDGISLVGVSAYRSYETQQSLFNYYVRTQGEEQARKYSAVPGHSEHQTGLAIDVAGGSGTCAVENCFADTPEAKWLAKHAPEHGFIIRYPKGKERVTGYNYEPWHIRYVGKQVAEEISKKGLTLEEYFTSYNLPHDTNMS